MKVYIVAEVAVHEREEVKGAFTSIARAEYFGRQLMAQQAKPDWVEIEIHETEIDEPDKGISNAMTVMKEGVKQWRF